jgi:short-subunit dehydrogenase
MQNWTLITGASEGLGSEFARIAAAEGRNLILTARSEDKLNALADELRSDAVEVVVIPADLNDLAQAEKMWAKASKTRHIDILINNAGLGRYGRYDDAEGWERELSTLNVNITALSLLMKRAIVHMQGHGGGRIMNLASTAAFMSGPKMAVYYATKAYVLSLSEAVAQELHGTGISITAACPGATSTAFLDTSAMRGISLFKMGKPMAATPVAHTAWKAMLKGRRIIVIGLINKTFAFLPRISPRAMVTYITSKVMEK